MSRSADPGLVEVTGDPSGTTPTTGEHHGNDPSRRTAPPARRAAARICRSRSGQVRGMARRTKGHRADVRCGHRHHSGCAHSRPRDVPRADPADRARVAGRTGRDGGLARGHMAPVVLFPGEMFPGGFPTLAAQYVLKDIILVGAWAVVAAHVLGARLIPGQLGRRDPKDRLRAASRPAEPARRPPRWRRTRPGTPPALGDSYADLHRLRANASPIDAEQR